MAYEGQTNTRPVLPIFEGGMTQIANGDRHAITIVGVTAWQAQGLHLTEIGYVERGPREHIGGFGGQSGDRSLAQAAAHSEEPGWTGLRPFIGARLAPCCGHTIYLAMAYRAAPGATVGRAAGVIVTYRTTAGHLYRALVPGEVGFSTDADTSARSEQESTRESVQLNAVVAGSPSAEALYRANWWHG